MKRAECHPDRNHIAKGLCRACYYQGYHKNNPDYYKSKLKSSKAWRDRNKEHLKEYDKVRNALRKDDPIQKETRHEYSIKRRYGLSKAQYESLLEKQDSKCALCDICPSKMRLAVDHSHETGQVRGLLCNACNAKLAWYENRIELIRKYLNERTRLSST